MPEPWRGSFLQKSLNVVQGYVEQSHVALINWQVLGSARWNEGFARILKESADRWRSRCYSKITASFQKVLVSKIRLAESSRKTDIPNHVIRPGRSEIASLHQFWTL